MRKQPSQMAHQVPLEKPINQKTPSLPTLQEPEEISKSNINCMEQGSTSPKRHENDGSSSEEIAVLEGQASAAGDVVVVDHEPSNVADEDSGRERLKRHRVEVAGQVWIPDIWGQEELLQDWIDCSAFDASLFPSGIMSARSALIEEGRRQNSARIRIENRCTSEDVLLSPLGGIHPPVNEEQIGHVDTVREIATAIGSVSASQLS